MQVFICTWILYWYKYIIDFGEICILQKNLILNTNVVCLYFIVNETKNENNNKLCKKLILFVSSQYKIKNTLIRYIYIQGVP